MTVRDGRGARLLVLLLVAFPLALVACGGDSSSKSPRSDGGAATGTTDASGATSASGATGAATGATGSTRKTKSTAGSGGASADTGGSSAASGAAGGTNKSERAAKAPVKKTKKPHFLPGAFVGQEKQLFDQSKRVCNALTLDGLAHEYDVTPKTPEAVARRYAQAYPPRIRKAVYRGCKAGLSK